MPKHPKQSASDLAWWCCQPYHPQPIKQDGSTDPNRCLVTVPYCIDFCWGPDYFFFGTSAEATETHTKLRQLQQQAKQSGKRLSQRVDALPGETEAEYDARVEALDQKMRKECGGKTYDEVTDEFLQQALDALK